MWSDHQHFSAVLHVVFESDGNFWGLVKRLFVFFQLSLEAVLCFQNLLGKTRKPQKPEIPLASHWFLPVSIFNHFYAKELWSELILAMIYPAWGFFDFCL